MAVGRGKLRDEEGNLLGLASPSRNPNWDLRKYQRDAGSKLKGGSLAATQKIGSCTANQQVGKVES